MSCAVCCNYSSQCFETYGKLLALLTNIRPVINVRELFMAIIYEWAKISYLACLKESVVTTAVNVLKLMVGSWPYSQI
jgi:hypothetical protein